MDPAILTLDDVADMLRVSRPTVRKAVREQGLPGAKIGTQWRFRREDVEAWLQKQTEESDGRRTA